MKHVAKFIPWLLLPEQKEHRAAVANDLIQATTSEPDFLKKATAGDESWVPSDDPETEAQSAPWESSGSLCLKKAQQSHNKIKTTLTVFFDWEGVVHHKYTPPGQTINKEYYLNVLCRLRDAVPQKELQLWATGDWQLHHDNTSAHASLLVQRFLVKHQITQVTQPPNSTDLEPCDF